MATINLLLLCYTLVAAVAGYYIVKLVGFSNRPKAFPPGPPTLPVLGNLHQIPTTKTFLKFDEWGKQYGSIIGLKLGPQNMVILNDYHHVMELFDRRGAIYSSRPSNHIATDIVFPNDVHMLFLPYGDSWRRLRKTASDLLRPGAVDELLPIQAAEATQTIHDLLHEPEKYYDHIRRYTTSVILASVFGLRGASFDSPRVKSLYHVQDQNTAINELGATPPVDIFPFLKTLPDFLSPWRKWARDITIEYKAMLSSLVEESRINSQRPNAPDCFLSRMMRERAKSGLTGEQAEHLAGSLMEAGSDTTASTLLSFLLAMATHPDVLRRCQREVDEVCGTSHSPSLEELDQLPYIRACMNETLRWRPVAPGGIPHALTQDDRYRDYVLPKGTIVFANSWSIHRTLEYANADQFVPERFLENEFGVQTNERSAQEREKRRPLYVWGAGRRVCSGQILAENSLMINMAKLVWAFDIVALKGAKLDDGISTGYYGGFLISPKEFPLDIKARSYDRAAVIESELKEAQPFLERFAE